MFPLEMKVTLSTFTSGQDTGRETATVRLQDTPYDEKWAAYYTETEESQKARGVKTGVTATSAYEVWIPHPTWPEIAEV